MDKLIEQLKILNDSIKDLTKSLDTITEKSEKKKSEKSEVKSDKKINPKK